MTLDALSERLWLAYAEYQPTIATVRGEHAFDDRLRDFSPDALQATADRFRAIGREAEAVDEETLSLQDRVTRSLLVHETKVWATEIEDRFLVAAVDPYLGAHTRLLSDTAQNTVTDLSQAAALLDRYAAIPAYLAGALQTHRAVAAEGMVPAAAPVSRVIDQVDGYLGSTLDTDPFLKLVLPDPSAQDSWLEQARALVEEVIRPAFERYRAGLAEHILPVCRPDDRPGLQWIPGGERIYAHLIEKYTQSGLDAAEIHRIGMEWATEILPEQWAEIGRAAFGESDMKAIFHRLHTDPTLRFTSEEEMLGHARDTVARAWEAVDDWFGSRPHTPCRVVPVPAAFAKDMPPAYYLQPTPDGTREGTYFLNTYGFAERDRFEYESTHFHEAIPGHHFDRSLATELVGIPLFRRFSQVFAHTEGWGLYAERLADEMGLYSSETDRLGMLTADAWRAGRLVVDTGMHAMGWTRRQAIDWLMEWTPIGRLTVEQEIDRYIGMPAQALAYKIGQLEIFRLRDQAKQKMGAAFDIKGFHDAVLTSGAVPLPMLRRLVEDWTG